MNPSESRQPVWAGSFYPAERESLQAQIKELAAPTMEPNGQLRGIIMPHAGYIYSGKTASYAEYDLRMSGPKRIVLLGPDHHVGMATTHICQQKYWQTPLGRIKIAPQASTLVANHQTVFKDTPRCDEKEHSLEVIVPFLQTWLDDFDLIPMVVGQVAPLPLAEAIRPLLDQDTVLVVSSDLSHFLNAGDAKTQDASTIKAIIDMDLKALALNTNKACGLIPICALLILAKAQHWTPRLLHYSHSGDVSGDQNRVVGYATIGLYTEDSDA